MPKQQTIHRHCLQATAPTMREARADIERQIDRALALDYSPYEATLAGWTIIVWATPNGHHSRIMYSKSSPGAIIPGCMGGFDRAQEIQSARRHLASTAEITEAQARAFFDTDTDSIADWLAHRAFLDAFNHARAAGDDMDQAIVAAHAAFSASMRAAFAAKVAA